MRNVWVLILEQRAVRDWLEWNVRNCTNLCLLTVKVMCCWSGLLSFVVGAVGAFQPLSHHDGAVHTGQTSEETRMCRHYPANTANSSGLPLHEQVWSNPMEGLLWLCMCVRVRVSVCGHVSLVQSDGKSVPWRILTFLLPASTVKDAITVLSSVSVTKKSCHSPCKSF